MGDISSLRLRYFPFTGRAAPIRDALNIGGIAFEDAHIPPQEFRQRREAGEFPFGGLPVMDIETGDSHICSAQSNAILRYAGRLSGLYPDGDPLLALKVDEAMDMGEEINSLMSPSIHEQDEVKRMAMRKTLAEETLPFWLGCFDKLLMANGNNGFIVGNSLTVADLKLHWIIDWLTCGMLDGIPTSLVDDYPAIVAWRKNVTGVRAAKLGETA